MGKIPVNPDIIPVPFADAGQKNAIPETVSIPGAANASWNEGFPAITMINKQAGGKPPIGKDFNGIFNQLSTNAFWAQSGGVYSWNNTLNYLRGCHVLASNGKEYTAVRPSGPDIPASGGYVGAKNPVTDTARTYWTPLITAEDLNRKANVEDLNRKANIDLDNVTSTGTTAMAHAAMPQLSAATRIQLAWPAASGGSITAPADGWINVRGISSGANGSLTVYNSASGMASGSLAGIADGPLHQFLPCSAGQVFNIDFYNVKNRAIYFFYANGNAPV